MKYIELKSGDKMPALGLGTWKSSKGEVYEAIRTAINLGYRHFDCAHLYANEAEIGDAFNDAFLAKDVKREELFITSKLWNNRHKKDQVIPALKRTLKDLKLDYLDLYLIHWPIVLVDEIVFPTKGDQMVSLSVVPLSETWEAMLEAQKQGLSKNVGVSNFSIEAIEGIVAATGEIPSVNQVEMHPFLQQKNMKIYCDKNNIVLTAYCPLGSGDRPENRKAADEPKLFENETILNIASELNITPAQVMLAWAVERNTVVIPKSVNPVRLKENLDAANVNIPDNYMKQLDDLGINYRFVKGDFWCLEGSDYTLKKLWGSNE